MRLPGFFYIALGLTALLHAYIGARLLPDLSLGTPGVLLGAAALLASVVLLPFAVLGRYIRHQPLGDRLTWAGSLAMGVFSWLLLFTLLRDVLLLVAWMAVSPALLAAITTWSALAVLALTLVVSIAGFFSARRLARIKHVDVPIAGLDGALHGFVIAQISDIHVGPTIKRGYLDRIVDAVNRLEADMIAITGDLVDGSVGDLAHHTAPLARLGARHGTYFVTGNHEYYAGAHAWIDELHRLGLTVLGNRHVVLSHDGASLVVAGVHDYTAHQFDPDHRSDPAGALHGAPAHAATRILLAHQPRTAHAAAEAGYHLQLSGHTHGGQFWPWNFFVPLQQPFTGGLNRLRDLWVYTSRGTGYWGPPNRFGVPSEITRIRLVTA
ncbi:metallophosphoesterase [Iodidimonas sp. SYSU 1G8]|uniref:metallophosphoesterase n=1 Tax=Iodidimonas sp. SYSU 1G8 TaxID=3133967 RepID=UPI0031FE827F